MRISLIVPVYREEKSLPEFFKRVPAILESITKDYEIIFSMDPSPDATETLILEAREKDDRIKLLKFSRRFGQPMATLAGLQYSKGDAVVVMDVDMQDPPELLVEMVKKWQEGYDVVLPQRRQRTGEPWIKRTITEVGYKVISKIANVNIPKNTGDFRLMSRRVVAEVARLKECHGFLRGMVAVVGFRQCLLPFDRPQRFAGETNYNKFTGSLRIGFNGIFCFSTYALSLSTLAGFIIASFSLGLALLYLIMKIAGFPFPIGNPTIVILLLFMSGIQLLGIGILGEYIGRIYEEVRERPKFIVDQSFGFDSVTPEKQNEQS